MALRAETPYALGSIIGCNALGGIIDKYGTKNATFFTLLVCLLNESALLAYNERNVFGWSSYAIAGLCGMQEGTLNTYGGALLGNEFNDKITPVSVVLVVKFFTLGSSMLANSQLETIEEYRTNLLLMMVVSLVGVLAMMYFPFKHK
jgi:MFS family permease